MFERRAAADAPAFEEAATRLDRELTEALDDDLNAPRAVAAMFAFVTAGNAALDGGQQPGPRAVATWERAEGVLRVTSEVRVMKVAQTAHSRAGEEIAELSPTPPSGVLEAERWARDWALRRARHKSARNYAEADRIRTLLGGHGFQIRDSKDGSIEVVRTGVAK